MWVALLPRDPVSEPAEQVVGPPFLPAFTQIAGVAVKGG